MPETRFPLGRVVAPPGALNAMEHNQSQPLTFLVDDFVLEEPTGSNTPRFRTVESKGVPLGQPAGPEPDNGHFAKCLRTSSLQLLHPVRLARAMWKSIAAFCALVLSQPRNHLHRVRAL